MRQEGNLESWKLGIPFSVGVMLEIQIFRTHTLFFFFLCRLCVLREGVQNEQWLLSQSLCMTKASVSKPPACGSNRIARLGDGGGDGLIVIV